MEGQRGEGMEGGASSHFLPQTLVSYATQVNHRSYKDGDWWSASW